MGKQRTLFHIKQKFEHGGELSRNKRRSRRPLALKKPLHMTLRSDLAKGVRSLLKNCSIVEKVIFRSALKFNIKVYQHAVVSNHVHILIQGQSRTDLQNFFRVVSGHIAQEILKLYPLQKHELPIAKGRGRGIAHRLRKTQSRHPKNIRKFWDLLLYSRSVSWGKEFSIVRRYIIKNTLEALGIIKYERAQKIQYQSVLLNRKKPKKNSS